MNNVVNFESREARINREIDSNVAAIVAQPRFELPKSDTALVTCFINKIQGTYDVERAKRDTDNAIELLYIAYNTTPQRVGEIRVGISAIMNKLITAQQKSELIMREAMSTATSIGKSLDDFFPDWLDVKEANDQAEIKAFVSKDLVKLATKIRDKALDVRDKLLTIASSYDGIIKDTVAATNKSETALGKEIEDRVAIEKEINEANARREQLESLVADLKTQVAEFERKARDYEQRANTAEQRAFVMSIIRVGAQMISEAIPAIAMAAGGPASMLVSSLGGMIDGQGKSGSGQSKGGDASSQSGSGQPSGSGKSGGDDAAKAETELSEKKAALKQSEAKRDELKSGIKTLEDSKKALEAEAAGSDPSSSKAVELAELDKRLKARTEQLKAEEDKIAQQQTLISSLQASLSALDKGLGKLSDEQQQQAASLREIQMQMINKAEAYEKERRNQSAELIKVNALLKGQQSTQETIKLAIQSLNVSISALKRMKEIVEEIAFFFKTFADFMQAVAEEAQQQVKSIESVAELDVIRKNRFAQLVKSVDEFFVRQTAEWYAVTIVCDRFHSGFAEGWSTLNKLQGTYLTEPELVTYLETASGRIREIVAEREAAADAKIATLNAYRNDLSESA